MLISFALAAPLSAQPTASPDKPVSAGNRRVSITQPTGAAGNAALTYYGVWASLGEADMKLINETYPESDFGKPLPQELYRLVSNRQNEIGRLIRASSVKNCDFGLEYGDGFMMLLPHLGKMRTTVRLLAADARRCLVEGKPDEAADRYAAIFGVAKHAGGDKVLISSLVSIAVASLPESDLVERKGAAMLTPAGRAKVLAAIGRFGGVEGFGIKSAIEGERFMAVDAAIERYDGPDAGKRLDADVLHFVDGMKEPNGLTPEQKTSAEKIRAMDGRALRAELQKLNPFYTAVLRAWDRPDAEAELERLSEKARAGEYGEFGYHFLPAVTKCRASQEKGRKSLDNIAEALRKADAEAAADTKAPK
jgi:hypothetical protein